MAQLFPSALALLIFAGCTVDTDPASPSAKCAGAPSYAEVQAFAKCKHCHASTLTSVAARNGAPPEINFDSYAGANSVAPEAKIQVEQGRMPPASSGLTLTSAEKEELLSWIDCGTNP